MSDVEAELTSATGDAPLCAISTSGGQVDGAEYLEGRMAALMELGADVSMSVRSATS
jgi:hypothetical protein